MLVAALESVSLPHNPLVSNNCHKPSKQIKSKETGKISRSKTVIPRKETSKMVAFKMEVHKMADLVRCQEMETVGLKEMGLKMEVCHRESQISKALPISQVKRIRRNSRKTMTPVIRKVTRKIRPIPKKPTLYLIK